MTTMTDPARVYFAFLPIISVFGRSVPMSSAIYSAISAAFKNVNRTAEQRKIPKSLCTVSLDY